MKFGVHVIDLEEHQELIDEPAQRKKCFLGHPNAELVRKSSIAIADRHSQV